MAVSFLIGIPPNWYTEKQNLKVLADIKRKIHYSDPGLDESDPHFRTLVVLAAAALIATADVERLVAATRYDRSFVDGIAQRMYQSGLWNCDGSLFVDTYLNEDQKFSKWQVGMYMHALVAEGHVVARQRDDGTWSYRAKGTSHVGLGSLPN